MSKNVAPTKGCSFLLGAWAALRRLCKWHGELHLYKNLFIIYHMHAIAFALCDIIKLKQ